MVERGILSKVVFFWQKFVHQYRVWRKGGNFQGLLCLPFKSGMHWLNSGLVGVLVSEIYTPTYVDYLLLTWTP